MQPSCPLAVLRIALRDDRLAPCDDENLHKHMEKSRNDQGKPLANCRYCGDEVGPAYFFSFVDHQPLVFVPVFPWMSQRVECLVP